MKMNFEKEICLTTVTLMLPCRNTHQPRTDGIKYSFRGCTLKILIDSFVRSHVILMMRKIQMEQRAAKAGIVENLYDAIAAIHEEDINIRLRVGVQ